MKVFLAAALALLSFGACTNESDGRAGLMDQNETSPIDVSSSPGAPCEQKSQDVSYGNTIPGRWLKELLLDLGVPGNYQVSSHQIQDTGTALRIDIPAYEGQFGIYAVMISIGDDASGTDARENRIGRQGTYDLYFDGGNQYRAANATWQLSLLAYPETPEGDISWPDQTTDWLMRAARRAEQSPPHCQEPIP